ncbi:MAG: tandem-95 repeat protein, partial [Microbacteriaceae bacterium]|nr:tandem-95 repeat protein [Microbacteriaceae bacterium]
GSKSVSFTISDGHATATGTLEVDVNPADSMDPVATPDFATTLSTTPVVLHPLANDQSPSGASLQLVSAKLEFGGSAALSVNQQESTITMSPSVAGQYYLLYTVVAGSHSTQGLDLVNVSDPVAGNPPPIAVDDVAYVRPGEPTSVNVLDNDVSPSGNVLVLQSVTPAADASTLNVEVLDKSIVRVTTPGVLTQQVQLSYTVSDGTKTAKAGITVVPIPPLVNHQAPVAVEDDVTVREGDIASVDVLNNDYSPDDEPFTLDSTLVDASGGGAGSTSFVSGSQVRYQAPTTGGNYTLSYGITDKFGQKAHGIISITVTAKSAKNSAPLPQELNARAFAGLTSVVVIPLDGIDPDGDSVSFAGIVSAPRLGRIVSTTATSFTYQAYTASAGTDHFQYSVVDALGKTATGTVNVGVVPPPATSKPPTAVDDKVEIKPGKTAAVPVLLNDSDPNGYTISLETKLPEVESPLTAKVSGGTVLVTAPQTEGDYTIQYRITNGQGGQANAYIQVAVTKDATPTYPTAIDHVISIEQLTGKSTADVNVFDGALNPSGVARDLKVAVKGTNAGAAQIGSTGKVTVTPGEHRMAIAYTLTDTTSGLAGEAFIIVPPKPGSPDASSAPPHIKAGIDTVIKMNGNATYDLSKIVDVPSGRPAKIVSASTTSATNSNGKSPFVSGQQLSFTAAKDYRGPAAITFQVNDGKDPGTTEDRLTLLTLPLTIGSADQSDVPPTFTPPSESIEAGEAATTIDLRDSTYQPNPQILSQVTYTDFSTSNPDITYTTSGSKLSISSAFGVQPGTTGVISFTVNSGDFTIQGSVNVKVVSSSKPLAQQKNAPQTSSVQRGNGSVTLTDAVGDAAWSNPFSAQGKSLTIIGATVASGPSGVHSSFTASTLTLSADTGAQTGTVTVNYTVQDATKDPARNVTGQWQVKIHDVPGAGSTPSASTANHNDTKADVTISDPVSNGDLTIDQYEIVSAPAAVDVTESAVGKYTVTGLTNGTSYTFKVRAHNSDGWGAYSGPSTAITPYGTPTAPTSLDGSASGAAPATVSFTWGAPSTTGGGSVTYHYSYDGGATVATTSRSYSSSGSQGAGSHTFTVYATNDGSGNQGPTASKSVSVSAASPQVTDVSKTPGSGPRTRTSPSGTSISNTYLFSFTVKDFGADAGPCTATPQFLLNGTWGNVAGSYSVTVPDNGTVNVPSAFLQAGYGDGVRMKLSCWGTSGTYGW